MSKKKKQKPLDITRSRVSSTGKKLSAQVLKLFHKNAGRAFNLKQIDKRLGAHDAATKKLIQTILNDFTRQDILSATNRGRYRLVTQSDPGSRGEPHDVYITGTVDMIVSGAAFIVTDDVKEDIYISTFNTKNALHGDKVKVLLHTDNFRPKQSRKGKIRKGPQGEIVKVISRSRTEFTGIINIASDFCFLSPDMQRMNVDIIIPSDKLKGAEDGQKALVRLNNWPENSSCPYGEVLKVLGSPGDHETEMGSIIAKHGLPSSFSNKLEKIARDLNEAIPREEIARRRDFQKVPTFTIDPADAKDFDDALSIRKLSNGNFEVGIHIADVTHYVKPGSALDKEAYKRATSVYLVDRVVPMLPEHLSNHVCSLNPGEEKLCFSAVFEITENAEITGEWYGKTVILSNKRFNYDEAQEIIDRHPAYQPSGTKQSLYAGSDNTTGDLTREILTANYLAKKLRLKRFDNGSIAFDRVEVKIELDDENKPIGIFPRVMKDSNKLIEDFMLLANSKVAEYIGKSKVKAKSNKVFVYRVHDSPDKEKLNDFIQFIKKFGYNMRIGSGGNIAGAMNGLFKEISGKPEENIIVTLAIRTMSKAFYTTDNIGHYGLAFDYYAHFTSPIRRYPDILVHRLLEHYLKNSDALISSDPDKRSKNVIGNEKLSPKYLDKNLIEEMCKHSSEMERKAEEAERESIKFKQVQFMKERIGEEFTGIISGVAEWGLYVELEENKCEGMIRVKEIEDDHYIYDQKSFCLKGKRKGKVYQLGDRVNVIINSADIDKRQLDLLLA